MKQNLILVVVLIALSFVIRYTIDYQVIQVIAASVWCFTLFWLLKNLIEARIKRKQNL